MNGKIKFQINDDIDEAIGDIDAVIDDIDDELSS